MASFGISYAGVTLPTPNQEISRWAVNNLDPRSMNLFQPRRIISRSKGLWSLPVTQFYRPISLGSLFWPAGSVRYAVGYYIATAAQVEAVKAATLVGGQYQSAPLILNAGQEVITANMWLLPPRPITFDYYAASQSSYPNSLYLLTLVDDRYFDWDQSIEYLSIDPAVTTWQDLIDQFVTSTGNSVTADPIDAAYLFPGDPLVSNSESITALLDTIAYNVGLRSVWGLDGSVYLANPDTGRAIVTNNLSTLANPPHAGGVMFTPRWGVADFNLTLPASTRLLFPRSLIGADDDEFYTITNNLVDLDIGEYNGVSGYPGFKVWEDAATAAVNMGSDVTPANDAELQALAARFSIDWYRHQQSGVDLILNGIRAWQPDPWNDIEWTVRKDQARTVVQRASWSDQVEYLVHANGNGESGGGGGGGGGGPGGGSCCPETTYPLLTGLTCTGGVATQTLTQFTFGNGLLMAVDGDYTADCKTTQTYTFVTAVTCTAGTFAKTTHTVTFNDGRMTAIDGDTTKGCGVQSLTILGGGVSCNTDSLMILDQVTLTWHNGYLFSVEAGPQITFPACTDCCDSGGGGGSHAVGCCSNTYLPDTIYVTFTGTGCSCLTSLGAVTLTWDGSKWTSGPVSTGCPGNPVTITFSTGCALTLSSPGYPGGPCTVLCSQFCVVTSPGTTLACSPFVATLNFASVPPPHCGYLPMCNVPSGLSNVTATVNP